MPMGALRRWGHGCAAALAIWAAASAHAVENARFTIHHTYDLHGRLLPFHYAERGRERQTPVVSGGASRRATLIRRDTNGQPRTAGVCRCLRLYRL